MNCKKCNNELATSLLYSSIYYNTHNEWLDIYQCPIDNSLWIIILTDDKDILTEVIPVID